MNLFTNAATVIFWFFNRYCNVHCRGRQDTATKEVLTEKNKKFELQKMFQLPWMFWTVMAFSLFQTSTASVFSQNATELAERRFNVDSITAGWYSSLSQYAGMMVPHLWFSLFRIDSGRFLSGPMFGCLYRCPREPRQCL